MNKQSIKKTLTTIGKGLDNVYTGADALAAVAFVFGLVLIVVPLIFAFVEWEVSWGICRIILVGMPLLWVSCPYFYRSGKAILGGT